MFEKNENSKNCVISFVTLVNITITIGIMHIFFLRKFKEIKLFLVIEEFFLSIDRFSMDRFEYLFY